MGNVLFKAIDLQFLYSPSQPGFWLGGEVDGSFDHRLHFYIPKKYGVVGIHPINLDTDTEAFSTISLVRPGRHSPAAHSRLC